MNQQTEFIEEKKVGSTPNVPPTNPPLTLDDLYLTSHEEVRIPSNGYVYSVASGIGDSKFVPMKYMTAADEDDLTSPTLLRQGKWLTKILANCIVLKTIDPDDLLVGDRNALLFWLRQTSYGANYKLNVTCQNCDCKQKFFSNDFQLDKLELRTLDVKPISPGINEFEFLLPMSKAKVIFSLLTSKMADELTKDEEAASTKGTSQEKRITSVLKKQIVAINGIRDKNQLNKFIENGMTAKDSLALRNYINEITPDIVLKQTATCSNTGKVQEFDIPIEAQFFLPSATS